MSIFTVNATKDTNSSQGMVTQVYSCNSFTAYEDGEIILREINGTSSDIQIWANEKNYNKIVITNPYGNIVYSQKSIKKTQNIGVNNE